MPMRTTPPEESVLNLTPMIDIVFLLIIFFMVGARFNEIEQQFDVRLPEASPLQPMSRLPDPVIVNVSPDGELSVNGDRLDPPALQVLLKKARESYADQTVLIRADGQGRYQGVIDVMDACHLAGIQNFSLAFQPRSGDGS